MNVQPPLARVIKISSVNFQPTTQSRTEELVVLQTIVRNRDIGLGGEGQGEGGGEG